MYKRQEITLYEEVTVIENKREETVIISSNNSNEIVTTKKECKIENKQASLGSDNIQIAVQTHSIKAIKKSLIRVTQTDHITCNEGTHSKYRPNINYNDNHNYNYKHYTGYYKPRIKKRSIIYEGLTQTANTEYCRHETSSKREKRDFIWSAHRMKFSPYECTSYTVKTNVDTMRVWNGNCHMSATMLQRN